jgi:hypothetical protein
MIYIRVEKWIRGDKNQRELIGELKIANDGSGSATSGNYDATLYGRKGRMGSTQIKNFPRHERHAWDLVAKVLNALNRG